MVDRSFVVLVPGQGLRPATDYRERRSRSTHLTKGFEDFENALLFRRDVVADDKQIHVTMLVRLPRRLAAKEHKFLWMEAFNNDPQVRLDHLGQAMNGISPVAQGEELNSAGEGAHGINRTGASYPFVNVSSRFSSVLATIVHAASSERLNRLSYGASPTFSRSTAEATFLR